MSAIAVSRGNRHAVCHFDAAIAISPEMLPPVDAVEKPSPNLPTYAPVIRAVGQITTPPPSPPRFADLYGSPQNHSESPSNPDFPQDSSASDISSLSRKSDFPRAPHPAVSPLAPHQPDSPHVAPAACAEPVRGALSRRDLRRHRRVASSPQPGPSEPGEGSYAETQRLVTSEIDGRSIVRPRHNRRSSAGGASGGSTETGSRENGRHCGDLYGRQEAVRLVSAGQPTAAVSAFSPKSPSFVSLSRKSPLPKSPSPQPPPRGSPPRRLSHSSDAIPLQRGGCSAEIPLQRGRRSAEFPLQSERVPRKSSSAEISSPRVFPAELPPPPSPRGFPSELPPSPSTTPREGASRAPPRSPAVGRLAAARAWNKMMAMPPLSTDLSAPPAELLSSSPRGVTTTASTTSGRTRSTFLPLYPEVDAPRHSSAELSPHGATITTPHQRSPLSRSPHPRSPLAQASPPSARAFPMDAGSAENLLRIARDDGIGSSSSTSSSSDSSGGSGSSRSTSSDSSISSNSSSDSGSSSGGSSNSRRLKREQQVPLDGSASAETVTAAEAATTATTAAAAAEAEAIARAAPDIPLDLLESARRLMAECEARGVRWELLNAAGVLSGRFAECAARGSSAEHVAATSPIPAGPPPTALRATPARAIPVSRLRRGRVSSCSSLPISADATSAFPSSPLSTSPLSPSPLSPLSAASACVLPASAAPSPAKPGPAESPSRRERSGAQGNARAQAILALAAQQQQQQKQKQKPQQRQLMVEGSKRDRVKQLRVLGKHGSFEQLSGFFSNVLSISRGSSGNGSTNSGCSSPCPSNPGSYLERISAGGKSLKPSDFVLKMPYEDIKARYSLGKKEIGEGRFGSIRTCLERSSGNFYACKTISKKIIETPEEAEDVRREVMFLATLKGHPYIVTLKEALEDKSAIHLIMELCPGGDLFERIKSRAQLTEPEAASILRQLLVALIHSHSLGILHRDVKPENILLCSPASCSSIKLIDFGVATVLPEGAQCNEAAGTPEYMAPEVYDEKYGFGADVWGAGVSLYVMLSGIPPFWESTNRSLEQAIRNKKLSFKHWKWADVSVEAKELISRMLEKDPSKRITAQEALAHPWITKLAPTAA